MQQKTKETQKRYNGFLQTPFLWKNKKVFNLNQIQIQKKSLKIDIKVDEKLRLGKYIERFVSYQLKQENDTTILCENIQIRQNKITLGELDCILKRKQKIIHLEIIYKFYLFDESVSNSEIHQFIGPNRNDTLAEKLTKLKNKQLPLLYTNACEIYLETIDLTALQMVQQVYFKAQLFVPYLQKNKVLSILNTDCIVGFYINQEKLSLFLNCKFFIPNKKNWLVIPHANVTWINFDVFSKVSKQYLDQKFSPLCWLKRQNGEIEKFFLIWW